MTAAPSVECKLTVVVGVRQKTNAYRRPFNPEYHARYCSLGCIHGIHCRTNTNCGRLKDALRQH